MVLVGDLDLDDTSRRVRELFDGIEPIGEGRPEVPGEPPPVAERRATIRFPGETTRMALAAHTCRMGEHGDFALDVLSQVMAGGKSSRLYKRMVLEDRLVTDVSTFNEVRLDPGLFWFTFELRPEVEPSDVEQCLRAELERVAAESTPRCKA